jgi:hypothetical protein
MFRRIVLSSVVTLSSLSFAVSSAGADQLFGFKAGYFALFGGDSRVESDVLNENIESFTFLVGDFSNATAEVEWLVGLGDYVEVGVGLGYYKRAVPSTYLDFIEDDGSEIAQDFRLSIIPITSTLRVFPIGRHGEFQPYAGVGLGVYRWRYSEIGEFIDFSDSSIFDGNYAAKGTDAGPVGVLGVRILLNDEFSIGGEFRYQRGKGHVGIDEGFLGENLDLGGYATQLMFHYRF